MSCVLSSALIYSTPYLLSVYRVFWHGALSVALYFRKVRTHRYLAFLQAMPAAENMYSACGHILQNHWQFFFWTPRVQYPALFLTLVVHISDNKVLPFTITFPFFTHGTVMFVCKSFNATAFHDTSESTSDSWDVIGYRIVVIEPSYFKVVSGYDILLFHAC